MSARPSSVSRLCALLGAAALLAGCSFHLLKPPPAPSYYDIPSARVSAQAGAPVAWQLSVDEPGASREINTDRILVRSGRAEVKYFGGVRWVDRSPRLVQARLAEGFDRSGRLVGVARGTLGIRTDYKLISDLRTFEVSTGGSKASVSIGLSVQLVRASTATIVAAKAFEESVPTDGQSIEAVASSFGAALDKVVASSIAWTLTAGEADFKGRPSGAAVR